MPLFMGVSLLLGVGEVIPSLTFWSCGICVCDAKKFRIHSIVYVQTLDCWYFGSSEAFIQCLEWWTWWKRLLVRHVVAEYSVATHGTDPALCVRRKGTPRFREKVCRVFYFTIKFFFSNFFFHRLFGNIQSPAPVTQWECFCFL